MQYEVQSDDLLEAVDECLHNVAPSESYIRGSTSSRTTPS
jgi:hypothetical protein